MQTGANLDAEWLHGGCDRLRASDGTSGPVESGEEAVAGGVHFDAAEAGELSSNGGVMVVEEVAPTPVAELRHLLRRPDDVRKEHRGQHRGDVAPARPFSPGVCEKRLDLSGQTFRIAHEQGVIMTRNLGMTGTGDVLSEMPRARHHKGI